MSTPEAPPPDAAPSPAPPPTWVAPSGSAPASPPSSLTPPPPLPAPSYGPPPGPSTILTAPDRKGLHPGAIAGIIAGIVVFVGAAVAVVMLAISAVNGLDSGNFGGGGFPVAEDLPPGDSTPLVEGEPGSPLAVAPTECEDACFTRASIDDVILNDSVFNALTLREHEPYYATMTTTAAAEFDSSVEGWKQSELGPAECFITWPYAPIVDPVDAEKVADDPVDYLGIHSDIDYYNEVDQVSRLFPDGDAASAYMVALDERIGDCPRFVDLIGLKTDFVARSPAIEVPDSVAAVGWTQKTQYNERYYVIDVQRGNLVVRTTGYTTGGFSELEFRDLVEQQAELLGELELAG